MTPPARDESPFPRTLQWPPVLLAVLLGLGTFLAYHNSFSGPFVFDDVPTIVENPTIRRLLDSLAPPTSSGLTVNGRPVVNFTLAVNYALGGLNPRGYHIANLSFHLIAGFLLFGVVRRTVSHSSLPSQANTIAFSSAALWMLHPLQTAGVTYVVQRSESLMGVFYLLTLYAFIRSTENHGITPAGDQSHGAGGNVWQGLAVLACALGMATKEVMVSAPLIVLLYDGIFITENFRSALRIRWRFYSLLGVTWLILAWLMVESGGRGGTAGFGLGVTGGSYALKQAEAVLHYLRLAAWPSPLVFDYGGMVLVQNFAAVWPQFLALGVLLAGTGYAVWRRHWTGFIGVWFFAILAPTSSVVPLADTMFEHRMYLPLAAVTLLAALGLRTWAGRWTNAIVACLAVGLGFATFQRNKVYGSELALWQDTVKKRPENVRAHYTLGSVQFDQGDVAGAITEYETALRLKPDSAPTHNNLGNALTRSGRIDEALPHYEAALANAPESADTHNNLANALVRLRRMPEARAHYEAALKFRPSFADAHNNLGNVLAQLGEFSAAAVHYRAALQLRPDLADAEANLGNVLAQSGRPEEAVPHYEAALRLRPNFLDAHLNLATALTEKRRWSEAAMHYEKVLQLEPGHPAAREALDLVRLRLEFQRN